MGKLLNGMFALGLFMGVVVTTFLFLGATNCESDSSILWFCNESPETVLAALTFIADIVSSIAWPLAILVVAILFKNPIERLFLGLKLNKLKVGQLEADFTNALDNAEAELAEGDQNDQIENVRPTDEMLGYLEVDKKFAILAVWLDLERKLNVLAEKRGVNAERGNRPVFYNPRALQKFSLSSPILKAINELRIARNRVSHEAEIELSTSQILRYLDLAADIERYLDKLIAAEV